MISFRKIVFWQNMASHHQAETLKALVRRGIKVTWCVDQLMGIDRAALGWSTPDMSGIEVMVVGKISKAERSKLLDQRDLHIFSPRGSAASWSLMREAIFRRIEFGFFCEKPNGTGLKLFFSRQFYSFLSVILPRPRIFLSLGQTGADFYQSLGFDDVAPFWYSVRSSSIFPTSGDSTGDYRFVVVARLVQLKRVDLILGAASRIKSKPWSMRVIGDGPERARLEERTKHLGISSRVEFKGARSSAECREEIARADSLILASEWEGWGAVVNEALAEGTRFIVSSACGSSCLVQLSENCHAFEFDNYDELSTVMSKHQALGKVPLGERINRINSHSLISGEAAADYIAKKVQGVDVLPPWQGGHP